MLGETHQLRRLLLAHNHISDASASVRPSAILAHARLHAGTVAIRRNPRCSRLRSCLPRLHASKPLALARATAALVSDNRAHRAPSFHRMRLNRVRRCSRACTSAAFRVRRACAAVHRSAAAAAVLALVSRLAAQQDYRAHWQSAPLAHTTERPNPSCRRRRPVLPSPLTSASIGHNLAAPAVGFSAPLPCVHPVPSSHTFRRTLPPPHH